MVQNKSLYGNSASNIFNNTLVLKSYELKTLNVMREEMNANIFGM